MDHPRRAHQRLFVPRSANSTLPAQVQAVFEPIKESDPSSGDESDYDCEWEPEEEVGEDSEGYAQIIQAYALEGPTPASRSAKVERELQRQEEKWRRYLSPPSNLLRCYGTKSVTDSIKKKSVDRDPIQL